MLSFFSVQILATLLPGVGLGISAGIGGGLGIAGGLGGGILPGVGLGNSILGLMRPSVIGTPSYGSPYGSPTTIIID